MKVPQETHIGFETREDAAAFVENSANELDEPDSHSICDNCRLKEEKNPDIKPDYVDLKGPWERCCLCAVLHDSGVYVLMSPEKCICKELRCTEQPS